MPKLVQIEEVKKQRKKLDLLGDNILLTKFSKNEFLIPVMNDPESGELWIANQQGMLKSIPTNKINELIPILEAFCGAQIINSFGKKHYMKSTASGDDVVIDRNKLMQAMRIYAQDNGLKREDIHKPGFHIFDDFIAYNTGEMIYFGRDNKIKDSNNIFENTNDLPDFKPVGLVTENPFTKEKFNGFFQTNNQATIRTSKDFTEKKYNKIPTVETNLNTAKFEKRFRNLIGNWQLSKAYNNHENYVDHDISITILIGFMISAKFSKYNRWTNHINIFGRSGVGKSWLADIVLQYFWGSGSFISSSDYTSASLYKKLDGHNLPLILDETQELGMDARKMQTILDLVKTTTTGDSAREVSDGATVKKYQVYSSITMIGSQPLTLEEQMLNRIIQISLFDPVKNNEFNFREDMIKEVIELQKICNKILLEKYYTYSKGERKRTLINNYHQNFQAYYKIFSDVNTITEARIKDVYCNILAYYDFVWIYDKDKNWSEIQIHERRVEFAKQVIDLLNNQEKNRIVPDGEKILDYLFNSQMGPYNQRYSLKNRIKYLFEDNGDFVAELRVLNKEISNYGIKIIYNELTGNSNIRYNSSNKYMDLMLFIEATNHEFIKIFKDHATYAISTGISNKSVIEMHLENYTMMGRKVFAKKTQYLAGPKYGFICPLFRVYTHFDETNIPTHTLQEIKEAIRTHYLT